MSHTTLHELTCANCGAPLKVTPTTTVVTCEYCQRAHAFAPPPTKVSSASGKYREGDAVRVAWGGEWWPGRVVRVAGDQRWEVSYDGWSAGHNEVVGSKRLATATDEPDDDDTNSDDEEDDSEHEVAPSERQDGVSKASPAAASFAAGDPVKVLWNGSWWNGRIVRVLAATAWEISYDGYGASWHETVGPDRLTPNTSSARTGAPLEAAARQGSGRQVLWLVAAGVALFVAIGSVLHWVGGR